MFHGILGLALPEQSCSPSCTPSFLTQLVTQQEADGVEEWTDIVSICLGNVGGGRIGFGGVEDVYIDDSENEVMWTPMRSLG